MSLIVRLFTNIGLQKRILLSVAVGLGVGLAGFAFLSIHFVNESTDRAIAEQLMLAQAAADHVDGVLQSVMGQLGTVAGWEGLQIQQGGVPEATPALTAAYGLMRDTVSRLMLLDRNGRVLAVAPADAPLVGADYSTRAYVQRSLSTGLSTIATAFGATQNGRAGLAVTAPVRDGYGILTGLLTGEVDLRPGSSPEILHPTMLGRTGYLQLVDENGLVLATTKPSDAKDAGFGEPGTFTSHPEHFPSLIREGRPVVRVCHTCHQTSSGLERGRDVMAFVPLAVAPLGVALRLAENDAFGTSNRLIWAVIVYSVAVLVIGLLFAWLSTNAVVRPLEALTTAARRIGGGDLDSPVRLGHRSGIGETTTLAATLEAMRRRLRASYDRIERLNRGLEERVAQRTRELSILFEVSQTLTSTVDVDALMQMVVDKIVSVVEAADAALLFRYEPGGQVLVPRAAVGYHAAPLETVRLQLGEAMAGKVLEAGRPLLFANGDEVAAALASARADNAEFLRRAREGLVQPEAALGAPIIFEGQIVGVLLLVNLRQRGTFAPSDVGMVQALSDQVAVAIEHARLVQEASQVQALREADRLKSEFLFNVSHELRTPLSSVVSLAEVLAADHRTISRRQLGQVLAIIERSAAHLKDMVENLLDAGSIQAGRFRVQQQAVALTTIVQDALACVQPLLNSKGQAVDLKLAERDLTVFADRDRIVQVLVNLISNANKYCPAGQLFQLSAERLGNRVHVTLADTGPGIAPDDQAHLFERFYRSARPLTASGAGLGLAIVKAIVEAHGGQIELESKVGLGTTVSFSLVVVEEAVAVDHPPDEHLATLKGVS